MHKRTMAGLFLSLLLISVEAAEPLALAEAERLALERDAVLAALKAEARALREAAVADGTLPDPRLKLGAMSVPVDTFDLDQEPMTQLQVGVQQMFPPGDTLAIRSRRTARLAAAREAAVAERIRRVRRDVRADWLETFYWDAAERVVRESRELFRQLVNITQAHYAAGRQNQQDVTRAQLELGLLDDREIRIQTMRERQRARLAKWIGGEHAGRPLTPGIPPLPGPPARADIAAVLGEHPVLKVADARVAAAEDSVALARQAYRPGWMLDVTYGFRDGRNPNGTERSDFVSAMVSLDLPLFTGNRQDRRVAAARRRLDAATDTRVERRRELVRMLEADYAAWTRLTERVDYYARHLVPKAAENAAAALHAYQSDTGDFTQLMRARITELETRLQYVRLHVDHIKAQARLLYLAGEDGKSDRGE